MKTAEFQIQELLGIGMTLVVLGIGLAYGLQIMGDTKADLCDDAGGTYASANATCYKWGNATNETTDSVEYNATQDSITGVSKIPEKLPTIATVVVAAVILGILVTYLWARFR